ncbi:HU family DNA-binding protein [Halomonas elongata]|uniref:HU family DNA-binding protein n=1 Tax=Halomonas elongata TaxID=2746 RepID=UPI0038D47577
MTPRDSMMTLSTTSRDHTKTLSQGDKLTLLGFGTFEARERAARTGRNPQTGEEMTIPAAKVPAFKAGQGLKDAVKG